MQTLRIQIYSEQGRGHFLFMCRDVSQSKYRQVVYEHFKQAPSTSKSNTINFVSSVPLREPTAQISLVSLDLQRYKSVFISNKNILHVKCDDDAITYRILHTTPPEPPESSATKLRMNSPVRTSHSLTVPSSDDVMTKRELN